MKILYVGNAQGLNNIGKYYLTEQRIINGFTRLGHTVYCFNDRDHSRYANIFRTQSLGLRQMNAKLIEDAVTYEPDIIVLSHCKKVQNETLGQIQNKIPSVKIIYTNVDPLSDSGNVKSIKQRVGVADTIFVTTAGDGLKQFTSSKAKVHYFPNPVDRAIDINKSYQNECDIDLLLMGRALTHQKDHRHELARYLMNNNDDVMNVRIGGMGVNDNLCYGASYMKILAKTKMGISLSKVSHHYLYASDRLSHYLASGIMTFIPDGAGFEDILDGGFVPFSSQEDLWDKAKYYHKNEQERVKIAKRGYELSHDIFSVDKVCQYMLDVVYDKNLDVPWPIN